MWNLSSLTFGRDVAAETEDKLVSLTHGDLRRGLGEAAVAPGLQFGQLPPEVSAGQSDHQHGVRLVPSLLEDDSNGVAPRRLLQLLCQGGEVAGLQRREEAHYQQSAARDRGAVKLQQRLVA